MTSQRGKFRAPVVRNASFTSDDFMISYKPVSAMLIAEMLYQ